MYLNGTKETSLDSKGRLVLQAGFRKEFADNKVVLVPVKDALYGFAPKDYADWVAKNCPEQDNVGSKDAARALAYNSASVEVELAKAGRLAVGRVSERIRERIGISTEVVVVGNGSHFEIRDKARWDARVAEELDDLLFA